MRVQTKVCVVLLHLSHLKASPNFEQSVSRLTSKGGVLLMTAKHTVIYKAEIN